MDFIRATSNQTQPQVRLWVPTASVTKQKRDNPPVGCVLLGSFLLGSVCHPALGIKEHQTEPTEKLPVLGWRQRKRCRKCSPGKSSSKMQRGLSQSRFYHLLKHSVHLPSRLLHSRGLHAGFIKSLSSAAFGTSGGYWLPMWQRLPIASRQPQEAEGEKGETAPKSCGPGDRHTWLCLVAGASKVCSQQNASILFSFSFIPGTAVCTSAFLRGYVRDFHPQTPRA